MSLQVWTSPHVCTANARMRIPLKQYWSLLNKYLKPQWPRAALLALLLLTQIGLSLLIPQIARFFIDTAISGGAVRSLVDAALLFIGVAIVGQVLAVAATYVGENVAWEATNALRFDLTLHCLGLDPSFHKAHTPGELIERIDGDVEVLSGFFSEFLITVLGNAMLLVGVLTLVFREDWRTGIALFLFVVFALLVLASLRSLGVRYWIRIREMSELFFGFLGELFAGIEDVRANRAQGYAMRRFHGIRRQ